MSNLIETIFFLLWHTKNYWWTQNVENRQMLLRAIVERLADDDSHLYRVIENDHPYCMEWLEELARLRKRKFYSVNPDTGLVVVEKAIKQSKVISSWDCSTAQILRDGKLGVLEASSTRCVSKEP